MVAYNIIMIKLAFFKFLVFTCNAIEFVAVFACLYAVAEVYLKYESKKDSAQWVQWTMYLTVGLAVVLVCATVKNTLLFKNKGQPQYPSESKNK